RLDLPPPALACIASFVFPRPRSLPDLHPFPTRRSSDLPEDTIAARSIVYLSLSFDHRVLDGAVAASFTSRLIQLLETPEELNQADRKSTRLNSSHVKISYAVFCLKKKKNKTNRSESKQS